MSSYGTFSTTRPAIGNIRDNLTGAVTPLVEQTSIGTVVRIGTVTPNFKTYKRVTRQGSTGLPINDFSYVRNSWNPHSGDMTVVGSGINLTYSGGSASLLIPQMDEALWASSDEVNSLINRANMKILEKLKDSKVNLLQVFAERKMTADLIGSTATRIGNAIMHVRRGNLVAAASALKTSVSRKQLARFNSEYRQTRNGGNAIARSWLELQYGWRPLIQDVYGSAEFLAAKQSHEVREQVKSKMSMNREESTKSFGTYDPRVRNIDISRYRYDVSVGVWFQTTNASLATVKEAGLLNPALIAWELTPWSFVVDWFVPVGSYLSSFDATVGLSFSKGYRTRFGTSTRSQHSFADGNTALIGRTLKGFSRSSKVRIENTRMRLLSFPSAPFPSFKNPFSFEHSANAVALLTQLFQNRKA